MKNLFRKLEFKSNIFIHSSEQNLAEKLSLKLIMYLTSNLVNENPRKILWLVNDPIVNNSDVENLIVDIGADKTLGENLNVIYLQNTLIDIEKPNMVKTVINLGYIKRYIKHNDIDFFCYSFYNISISDRSSLEKFLTKNNIKSIVTIDDGYPINEIEKEDVIISSAKDVSSFMVHYLNGRKQLEAMLFNEDKLNYTQTIY